MELSNTIAEKQMKEYLEVGAHIWKFTFSYYNPMALKCALELGIPDAMQQHGAPITLDELATAIAINPNNTSSLYRLMRYLIYNQIFSLSKSSNGDEVYDLTIYSQRLLKNHPATLAPFILAMLDPIMVEQTHQMSSWFKSDETNLYEFVHGRSVWETAADSPQLNERIQKGMSIDARVVATLLLDNNHFRSSIEGIESLVEVGGGDGTMSKAIAEAYPNMKCTVLDLPHVVDGLQGNGSNLAYVAGDMFVEVPPADAVLLEWILHDWSDIDCIKILGQCKESISTKGKRGKSIIIDIVIENHADDPYHFGRQIMSDMVMMCTGGKERTEQDWKELFIQVGCHEYKIFPILGPRSVIEVYV